MSVDKSIQDIDLSSIPGEFRENYRFLNELISCKEKNQAVGKCFDEFLEKRLSSLRGRLNRRQIKLSSSKGTEPTRQIPQMDSPVNLVFC